jgi:hypothetical protein
LAVRRFCLRAWFVGFSANARGDSFRKITARLNLAGVPTAQGGREWYAATVRQVLLRTS